MQKHDVDAPQPPSDDSISSSISEADSIPSRRRKLKKLARNMSADQGMHLRELKRRAGKKLHNLRIRKPGSNELHFELLVQDLAGVLSLEPPQTRRQDCKFRIHQHSL